MKLCLPMKGHISSALDTKKKQVIEPGHLHPYETLLIPVT